MKVLLIVVGIFAVPVLTLMVLERDPDTTITRTVSAAGAGNVFRASLENLQYWMHAHPTVAIQLAPACVDASRRSYPEWVRTTEARICKAAVNEAAYRELKDLRVVATN